MLVLLFVRSYTAGLTCGDKTVFGLFSFVPFQMRAAHVHTSVTIPPPGSGYEMAMRRKFCSRDAPIGIPLALPDERTRKRE